MNESTPPRPRRRSSLPALLCLAAGILMIAFDDLSLWAPVAFVATALLYPWNAPPQPDAPRGEASLPAPRD